MSHGREASFDLGMNWIWRENSTDRLFAKFTKQIRPLDFEHKPWVTSQKSTAFVYFFIKETS
jgi:hypothetical protein